MKVWTCKIGEVDDALIPPGGDSPMREAVARAYEELTGAEPTFLFSGWGGELTKPERAVVEDREPSNDLPDGYGTTAEEERRVRGTCLHRDRRAYLQMWAEDILDHQPGGGFPSTPDTVEFWRTAFWTLIGASGTNSSPRKRTVALIALTEALAFDQICGTCDGRGCPTCSDITPG